MNWQNDLPAAEKGTSIRFARAGVFLGRTTHE